MRVLILFIGFAFPIMLSGEALACSCFGPATVEKGYARAAAVFTGEVISSSAAEIKFKVEKVWKGKVGAEVVLHDPYAGGSCGSYFATGQRYVVFASQAKEENTVVLTTDPCSWTTEMSKAAKVIKKLDKLKARSAGFRTLRASPIRWN